MPIDSEAHFNPEEESSDPRRDLLISGPIERSDDFNHREFEREVCAQTFEASISQDGIIVKPTGLYIPEDERRLEWENPRKLESSAPQQFEAYINAQKALQNILKTGSPQIDSPLQISGRVAFGTIYSFDSPETGEPSLIVRFNNDPNNPYHDYANPCSGMVRTLPTRFHPGEQLRANYSEMIPASIGPDGEIIPYIPSVFGGKTGGRGRRDYRMKTMAVAGQPFGADTQEMFRGFQLEHRPTNYTSVPGRISGGVTRDFTAVPIEHGTSVAVQIPGKDESRKQKNLLVSVTAAGAIECQRFVQIPPPDTLFDSEYGSKIAVISVRELTDYLEHIYQSPENLSHYTSNQRVPNPPLIRYEKFIDGATGKPATDASEQGLDTSKNILSNFQISPPLRVLAEYLYRQRERNS